jgi:hypothetical protein
MPQFLAAVLMTWPIYLLPAIIFAAPTAIVTRKKVAWRWADCSVFILPWSLWAIFFALGQRRASLSSALFENLFLGLMAGFSFVLLAYLRVRKRDVSGRALILISLCVAAVVTWACFPFLGE